MYLTLYQCRRDRDRARALMQPGKFIEVYMKVRRALAHEHALCAASDAVGQCLPPCVVGCAFKVLGHDHVWTGVQGGPCCSVTAQRTASTSPPVMAP